MPKRIVVGAQAIREIRLLRRKIESDGAQSHSVLLAGGWACPPPPAYLHHDLHKTGDRRHAILSAFLWQ
jgi:hypothetical protein